MRILYITKENPTSALGHAPDRARQFLLQLKKNNHEVRCVFPSNKDDGGLPSTRSYIEKILGIFKSYHERRAGNSFWQVLRKLIESEKFDFIVAEELSAGLLALKQKTVDQPPICYVAHNVESDLYRQIVGPEVLEKIRAKNLLKTERWVLRNADLVFSFSIEDRKRLQTISGRSDIVLTRAGVCLPAKPAETAKNEKVIFVGALDYFPNIQALEWYAEEIHTLIKKKYELVVVGRNPGTLVKAICHKYNFTLVASPPEIDSILRQAALEVVPLLSGSGTRGKILEAAAYGIPVISTTLGAQGLGFTNREAIIIADQARQFAGEVEHFLNAPQERTKIANASLNYVQKFNYDSVVVDFLAELNKFK